MSQPFPLRLPQSLNRLLKGLAGMGGKPYVVGGTVRDAWLGYDLTSVDYDIEVYGLDASALRAQLEQHGRVDAVGQAFTVFKLSGLEGIDQAVDVSIPRSDSKIGPGHRGIAVVGDPELSIEAASRRRDFTMNALLYDPRAHAILDPFGGCADLEARCLRAVDPKTFGEDPLRALRAVQFAARFEFDVDVDTARLCASMPLEELPAERIFGEIEKLLMQSRRPSIGLALMAEWGMLPRLAPELIPLADTPQDPEWHPEGDVWTHTLMVVDEAARLRDDLEHPRALTVMLGALCHDLGKPPTTEFIDGRVRSRGHEEAGIAPTLALLDRWNVHSLLGYDVRAQVVALVADHLKPGQLYYDKERVGDGAIRRLARRCDAELLYRVSRADCLGRGGDFAPDAMEWFRRRVQELGATSKGPEPLIGGRDILAMGVAAGPRVGEILHAIYERQLDGGLSTPEEARSAARRLIEREGV